MNREEPRPDPMPIQPRTDVPQQDPLVNPGYQPVPQELPADDQSESVKAPCGPAKDLA